MKLIDARNPNLVQQDHQVIYTQNINFFSPPTSFNYSGGLDPLYMNYTDLLLKSLMLSPNAHGSSESLHDPSLISNDSKKVPYLKKKLKGRKSKIKDDQTQLEKVRQAYLSPAISKAFTERNEIRKKKQEEIKRFSEELDMLGRQRTYVKEQEKKGTLHDSTSKGLEKVDSGGRPSSSGFKRPKEKFYLPTLNQMSTLSTATFSQKNTFESRSKDFSSSSPKKQLSLLSSLDNLSSNYRYIFK
jgi:hypothetical protein